MSTPTLRSVTVKYQADPNYPVMTASVKYRVFDFETEITFPTGDKRTFKNWDVRGLRESYFKDEIAQQHSVEDGASTRSKVELIEHGVRPQDVIRFVAELSQNSRYEAFFDMDFSQVVLETPESKTPAAKVEPKPKTTKPGRKFPYLEVAKLWAEGKTQREIAAAIGYLDANPKDPCHTLRTFLTKMHKGYPDATGQKVKLPYRDKARKAAAGA